MLVEWSNGGVFAAISGQGKILMLRDTKHANVVDIVTTFASEFANPHGITLAGNPTTDRLWGPVIDGWPPSDYLARIQQWITLRLCRAPPRSRFWQQATGLGGAQKDSRSAIRTARAARRKSVSRRYRGDAFVVFHASGLYAYMVRAMVSTPAQSGVADSAPDLVPVSHCAP